MKRSGIDHPKTKRLARELGLAHYAAVGLLECLFQFTAKHAIRGDIGKWTDGEIADAIGWPSEDSNRLIAALISCRWIDRHPDEKIRLLIHDWKDHADDSVRKTLKSRNEPFLTIPEFSGKVGDSSETVPDESVLPSLSLPSHSLPEPEPLDAHTVSEKQIKEAVKAAPISEPFNTRPVREALVRWFSVQSKRGRCPIDVAQAAFAAVQQFSGRQPQDLVQCVNFAIANDCKNLRSSYAESNETTPSSDEPEPKWR